ncbi:MAG: hypothetical protein WKH64_02300 [Chloroflexia bacterium]
MSTYGGCGDVARNTLTCPVADLLPGSHYDYQQLAQEVSDHFMPDSTAYYELWLDGEKVLADGERVKVVPNRKETLYGATYMPRKHKMGIGLPHDNCIDILTQDLALEAIEGEGGDVLGFNLLAGGGLGSTHNKPDTFPRLADRIGFLSPDQAIPVLEAATTVYRDYGDRTNRRHARLKYVLEQRGAAWFRSEVEARLGWAPDDPAPAPEYSVDDHPAGSSRRTAGGCGRWVENGRVQDAPGRPTKAGLRAIVEIGPELRLTAHQNIVLANIPAELKPRVEAMLAEYNPSAGGQELSTSDATHGLPRAADVRPRRGGERALPARRRLGA